LFHSAGYAPTVLPGPACIVKSKGCIAIPGSTTIDKPAALFAFFVVEHQPGLAAALPGQLMSIKHRWRQVLFTEEAQLYRAICFPNLYFSARRYRICLRKTCTCC